MWVVGRVSHGHRTYKERREQLFVLRGRCGAVVGDHVGYLPCTYVRARVNWWWQLGWDLTFRASCRLAHADLPWLLGQ